MKTKPEPKPRRVRCVACSALLPREKTRPARDPGKRCCIEFAQCFARFHRSRVGE